MCRACVLKALKDIANYFTKEQGHVAVSKGEYESAAHQTTAKPIVSYHKYNRYVMPGVAIHYYKQI